MAMRLSQARTWFIVVLILITVATILLGPGASMAYANTQIELNLGPAQFSDGGEFQGRFTDGSTMNNVVADNGTFQLYCGVQTSPGYNFVTFCAQTTEYFNPGGIYPIARIDTYSDHSVPELSLTTQAAYLFHMFNSGSWAGYDYSSSEDAGALQLALWSFQGMSAPSAFGPISATVATKRDQWRAEALSSGWTSINDVRIMQLGPNQDQFCELSPHRTSSPPSMTPEPTTIGMLLMGCCTLPLPLLRRRRKVS